LYHRKKELYTNDVIYKYKIKVNFIKDYKKAHVTIEHVITFHNIYNIISIYYSYGNNILLLLI